MNKFWEYISRKVTGEQYNDLTKLLNCSEHRLTRLFSGNSDFTIKEIEILSGLTGDDALELATRFELGYSTNTVREFQVLAKNSGHTLTLNAA